MPGAGYPTLRFLKGGRNSNQILVLPLQHFHHPVKVLQRGVLDHDLPFSLAVGGLAHPITVALKLGLPVIFQHVVPEK